MDVMEDVPPPKTKKKRLIVKKRAAKNNMNLSNLSMMNTTMNSSVVKASLRSNNKALAKALETKKQENAIMQKELIRMREREQSLLLDRRRTDTIGMEVKLNHVKTHLNDASVKLLETVDILRTAMEMCYTETRRVSLPEAAETSLQSVENSPGTTEANIEENVVVEKTAENVANTRRRNVKLPARVPVGECAPPSPQNDQPEQGRDSLEGGDTSATRESIGEVPADLPAQDEPADECENQDVINTMGQVFNNVRSAAIDLSVIAEQSYIGADITLASHLEKTNTPTDTTKAASRLSDKPAKRSRSSSRRSAVIYHRPSIETQDKEAQPTGQEEPPQADEHQSRRRSLSNEERKPSRSRSRSRQKQKQETERPRRRTRSMTQECATFPINSAKFPTPLANDDDDDFLPDDCTEILTGGPEYNPVVVSNTPGTSANKSESSANAPEADTNVPEASEAQIENNKEANVDDDNDDSSNKEMQDEIEEYQRIFNINPKRPKVIHTPVKSANNSLQESFVEDNQNKSANKDDEIFMPRFIALEPPKGSKLKPPSKPFNKRSPVIGTKAKRTSFESRKSLEFRRSFDKRRSLDSNRSSLPGISKTKVPQVQEVTHQEENTQKDPTDAPCATDESSQQKETKTSQSRRGTFVLDKPDSSTKKVENKDDGVFRAPLPVTPIEKDKKSRRGAIGGKNAAENKAAASENKSNTRRGTFVVSADKENESKTRRGTFCVKKNTENIVSDDDGILNVSSSILIASESESDYEDFVIPSSQIPSKGVITRVGPPDIVVKQPTPEKEKKNVPSKTTAVDDSTNETLCDSMDMELTEVINVVRTPETRVPETEGVPVPEFVKEAAKHYKKSLDVAPSPQLENNAEIEEDIPQPNENEGDGDVPEIQEPEVESKNVQTEAKSKKTKQTRPTRNIIVCYSESEISSGEEYESVPSEPENKPKRKRTSKLVKRQSRADRKRNESEESEQPSPVVKRNVRAKSHKKSKVLSDDEHPVTDDDQGTEKECVKEIEGKKMKKDEIDKKCKVLSDDEYEDEDVKVTDDDQGSEDECTEEVEDKESRENKVDNLNVRGRRSVRSKARINYTEPDDTINESAVVSKQKKVFPDSDSEEDDDFVLKTNKKPKKNKIDGKSGEIDSASEGEPGKTKKKFNMYLSKPGKITFTSGRNNVDDVIQGKKSRSKTRSTIQPKPRTVARSKPRMLNTQIAMLKAKAPEPGKEKSVFDLSLNDSQFVNKEAPKISEFMKRKPVENAPKQNKGSEHEDAENLDIPDNDTTDCTPTNHGIMLVLGNGKRTKPRKHRTKSVSYSEKLFDTRIRSPATPQGESRLSTNAGRTPPKGVAPTEKGVAPVDHIHSDDAAIHDTPPKTLDVDVTVVPESPFVSSAPDESVPPPNVKLQGPATVSSILPQSGLHDESVDTSKIFSPSQLKRAKINDPVIAPKILETEQEYPPKKKIKKGKKTDKLPVSKLKMLKMKAAAQLEEESPKESEFESIRKTHRPTTDSSRSKKLQKPAKSSKREETDSVKSSVRENDHSNRNLNQESDDSVEHSERIHSDLHESAKNEKTSKVPKHQEDDTDEIYVDKTKSKVAKTVSKVPKRSKSSKYRDESPGYVNIPKSVKYKASSENNSEDTKNDAENRPVDSDNETNEDDCQIVSVNKTQKSQSKLKLGGKEKSKKTTVSSAQAEPEVSPPIDRLSVDLHPPRLSTDVSTSGRTSRRAASNVNYAEPKLGTKLRRGDSISTTIYSGKDVPTTSKSKKKGGTRLKVSTSKPLRQSTLENQLSDEDVS